MGIDRFVLRNAFTLNGVTVFNEAFPFAALSNGERYSDCIKLTGSFGSIVLPAEITDCNFDPRYTCYVERTAVLENVTGTVTAFALTSDGETEATHASTDPIAVGGRATVVARVYLEWNGTEVQPCAGENALIKWLLGCADTPTFSIGLGSDYRRFTDPVFRDESGLVTVPATVGFSNGAIEIGGEFAAQWNKEIVLLAGGVPVLRARAGRLKQFARALTLAVRGHYAAFDGDAISLTSVTYGEKAATAKLVPRFCSAASPMRVDGKFEAGALFGQGKYFGIKTSTEATVFTFRGGSLRPVRKVLHASGAVDVARDGTVVVCDGELRVYYPDFTVKRTAMDKPDRMLIAGDKNALHIALLYGTTLKRYRVEKSLQALLETAENVTFLGRAGDKILFVSGGTAYAKPLGKADAVTAGFLTSALGDGTAEGDDGVILTAGKATDVETGVSRNGFSTLGGGALIGGGKIWVRDYSENGFVAVADVPAGTVALRQADDCIVGVDDAGLWYMLLEIGGGAVHADAFDGGTATVSATFGTSIVDGAGACKYSIKLQF